MFNRKKIEVKVLPGRNPSKEQQPFYDAAYTLWEKEWSYFWKSLAGKNRICSDAFRKQDEVVAVFYENECIALSLYTEFDLQIEADRKDNYFQSVWIPEAHEKLAEKFPKVLAGSHITTLKSWRRNAKGFSIKDLLMAFLILRFKETDNPVMIGAMRNNKGVNELAYRFGAERFMVVYNDEMTLDLDLVVFPKDNCHLSKDPQIQRIATDAWNRWLEESNKQNLKAS